MMTLLTHSVNNKNQHFAALFVDVPMAFDTVDCDILLNKQFPLVLMN